MPNCCAEIRKLGPRNALGVGRDNLCSTPDVAGSNPRIPRVDPRDVKHFGARRALTKNLATPEKLALTSWQGVARGLLFQVWAKLKSIFNFALFEPEEKKLRRKGEKSTTRPPEWESLDKLQAGLAARVVHVQGSSAITRRLMEMGIVPGAPIMVVRTAPLGDPIQVCLRDYHLALRRVEARAIAVLVGI